MQKFLVGLSVLLVSGVVSAVTHTITSPASQTNANSSSVTKTSSATDSKNFIPHVMTAPNNERIVFLDPVHVLKFRITPDGTYLTSDDEKLNVNAFVKDAQSIQPSTSASHVKESIKLPSVHALTINGPFTCHVTTGVKNERIVLSGINHPYSALKVDIKPNAVDLSSDQKELYMDVFVKDLHSLILNNLKEATVQATEPTSISLLTSDVVQLQIHGAIAMPLLRIEGKTNAQIEGNMNIQDMQANHSGKIQMRDLASDHFQLTQKGDGDISIQADVTNIKVNHSGRGHLEINPLHNYSFILNDSGAKGGSVNLIGNTHRFVAHLKDQSSLEAYNFLADLVYITTADSAVAHINPLDRLFAASTDMSKIDYIHQPDHRFIYPSAFSHILYLTNP